MDNSLSLRSLLSTFAFTLFLYKNLNRGTQAAGNRSRIKEKEKLIALILSKIV